MAGVFDSAEQALRNNELESIRAVYNQIIFGLRSEDPDLIEIFADPKQSVRAMDTLIQLSSYSGSDLAGDLASIKCDVSDQFSVIDTLLTYHNLLGTNGCSTTTTFNYSIVLMLIYSISH
jgi:hypothetical protein